MRGNSSAVTITSGPIHTGPPPLYDPGAWLKTDAVEMSAQHPSNKNAATFGKPVMQTPSNISSWPRSQPVVTQSEIATSNTNGPVQGPSSDSNKPSVFHEIATVFARASEEITHSGAKTARNVEGGETEETKSTLTLAKPPDSPSHLSQTDHDMGSRSPFISRNQPLHNHQQMRDPVAILVPVKTAGTERSTGSVLTDANMNISVTSPPAAPVPQSNALEEGEVLDSPACSAPNPLEETNKRSPLASSIAVHSVRKEGLYSTATRQGSVPVVFGQASSPIVRGRFGWGFTQSDGPKWPAKENERPVSAGASTFGNPTTNPAEHSETRLEVQGFKDMARPRFASQPPSDRASLPASFGKGNANPIWTSYRKAVHGESSADSEKSIIDEDDVCT